MQVVQGSPAIALLLSQVTATAASSLAMCFFMDTQPPCECSTKSLGSNASFPFIRSVLILRTDRPTANGCNPATMLTHELAATLLSTSTTRLQSLSTRVCAE